jgi:hypothetical protein
MSDAGMSMDLPSPPPPPPAGGHEFVVQHHAPELSRDRPLVIKLPLPAGYAVLPSLPRVEAPPPEAAD